MLRRLGIGFTALALLWPGMAAALGVGDYSLNSYLNQPLDMEITLRDTRGLNEEQLLVSLASDRDFAMAGIDRQSMHSELRFDVTINDDGSGVVRITTRQPVREPYLNFLVEYLWPTGRMLRDYTVLLDPPSYAADRRDAPAAPATSAPARRDTAPAAPSRPAADAPREPARVATPDRPRQTRPAATDTGPRSTHTVRSSDTMWRIARDNRPSSSVSVQQMMVVIQEMNPDAFINDNVNLVREGAVLRLPTEQEVRATTTRDALASVAEQNRQWREMLQARGIAVPGRQQLDGTPRTIEESVATTRPDQGQVRLVAPESAGTGAGTGAGSAREGDSAALQNELAIRDENLDQLRRENRELAERLNDLEGQVDTSEQILSLRNDQITRLQEELRRLREERGIEIEDDSLLAPVPGPGRDQDEAAADETVASDDDAAEDGSDDAVAAAPAGPAAIEPETAPPRPEPILPAPAQPSLMDSLLGNPLLLGAAAGLLVLLAVLAVVMRRRQQAAAMDDEEYEEYEEGDAFGDDDDFLPPLSDDDDDASGRDGPMGDEAPMQQPGQDPAEQVDVFMAYGQYPQALSHLRSAINAEPRRIDLKKRLLDVLVESNDAPAFEQEATKLSGLDRDLDQHITALRSRLQGADAAQDDDELSFDDLAMDLTAEPTSQSAPTVADEADEEEALSLDFGDDGSDGGRNLETLSLDDGENNLDDLGDFDLELPDAQPETQQAAGPATSAPVANNRYSLNEVDDLSEDEVSASLGAESVLELDGDAGTLDEADMDFGELKLDDVSDEFSGVDSDTASLDVDDLDLSLDDLDLGKQPGNRAPQSDDLELTLDDADLEESSDFGSSDFESPGFESDAASKADLNDLALTDSAVDDSGLDDLSLDDLSLDEAPNEAEPAPTPAPAPAPPAVAASLPEDAGLGDDDDFDFLGETDENATKLDLARAYIDMGDTEGARDILNEVVSEGNDQQQSEARELLTQVG
ncbi:peptigoglycan-binding protein LysM [Alcanivorax sp. JB21]|uniref:FimV/HubP family polar landmark protein n=1 Tax=Alcanivorax limicola TaxID=2874102 RepID=UPI001CBC5EC8|nr:FimV/HubP family polar landmark protein [Alcanivorax limicola]MBZ2187671.1 peptigoglycan-binding protein LysM [Alcanivorax limicola]